MNIAINPEAPEYRASIKLTPVEPMKVTNHYHRSNPKSVGTFLLVAWVLLLVGGFIMGTI